MISLLFSSCSGNLNTITGQNLNFLLDKYRKENIQELIKDLYAIKNTRVYNLPEDETWKVGLIEELSLIKKNHLDISFENDDLEEILEVICTAYCWVGGTIYLSTQDCTSF